jgi:hypothetical protein
MSVQGAIDCLKSIQRLGLREVLYACDTEDALYSCLSENGFAFDDNDFEIAVTQLDANCQFPTQLEELKTQADWFRAVAFDG